MRIQTSGPTLFSTHLRPQRAVGSPLDSVQLGASSSLPRTALRPELELAPGETALLYGPDGSARRLASPYRGLREIFQRVGGWTVYSSLDRDYALNVVDPAGRPVARLDPRTGGGHLSQVLLDPARQRLYLLANRYQGEAVSTLVAVDLTSGRECARLEMPEGEQVEHLHPTSRGLLALGPVGALGLGPDLEIESRTAPPGFLPNRAHPLPEGRQLLLGNRFLEGGQVRADYHPHAAILGPGGEELGRISDVKDWFHVDDQHLVYTAYHRNQLVKRDLRTGEETRREVPDGTTAALERPDGSLLALASQGGNLSLQLVSNRGRVTEKHRFGDFSRLESLLLHPGAARADLTLFSQGKHRLYRLDLDGPGPLESLWGLVASDTGRWHEHELPLFESSQPFVPLGLRDGRILCVFKDRTELLDSAGRACSPLEERPDILVRPFPGLSQVDFGDPVAWARAQLPHEIPGTVSFPAPPASEEVRQELEPVERDRVREFWDGALSGPMPGLSARLVGQPGKLLVLDGSRELSMQLPLREQTFVRALPLSDGLVAVACSDNSLMLYNGVSRHGPSTARRYQLDAPVLSLEVSPAGRLLARCQDQSVLAVDVGHPLARPEPGGRTPTRMEERPDAVVMGGVRLRRRADAEAPS